jgi:thymidine kinase
MSNTNCIDCHSASTNESPDNPIKYDKMIGKKCTETLNDSQETKRYGEESFTRHRGTLYIRIGPMFSAKSTWLNGELTQLADTGFSVLKITHADDIREDVSACDNSGSTHNSSYKSLSNKITCIRASELTNIDVSKYHAIGVDESQFFPDLLTAVKIWVEDKGKHVRAVGLDGDFSKGKFGLILDLIPLCDEVVKLHARCRMCLDELKQADFHGNILSIAGPFTRRLGASKEQKVVGGSDEYIPVCRYHHSSEL